MTRRRLLSEMGSPELAGWVAFYALAAEESERAPEPNDEELEAKLNAWMAAQNARPQP